MLKGLSAKGKIWRLPQDIKPEADVLEVVGSELLARILLNRGVSTASQARSFISSDEYTPASPLELPGMDKALQRINRALDNNEQITVYGDYDVDGITGTSLLLQGLRSLNAKVGYYIPNRASEGYGLNLKAVSILASKQRTKLLITCDCGVSNFAEINFASSFGIDTIVLDHHTLPELLPPAKAIVHPKLLATEHPLFDLPGVGVAFKVIEALFTEHGRPDEVAEFLDYVALGMIADLVPLVRENRYLVQLGLRCLIKSKRPGLQALLSQVQKSGDADLVGFGLAPRINAVGRLSDANAAVELLTTNDDALARKLALELNNENTRRQQICEQVLAEAQQMIAHTVDMQNQKGIAIYRKGWHHGVVGIVASRLVEKYHRPVFIAELDESEGVLRGSARGIEGLDLCDVLRLNESLATKWGGHKMAAGFSVPAEKADAFCAAIVATCNRLLNNKIMAPILSIDLALDDIAIDLFAFAHSLNKLAPFGMGNKKPLFYARKLRLEKTSPLGRENKHKRLDLSEDISGTNLSCLFWNAHENIPEDGALIDIVFTPEINVYNGRQRLQLILSDWRISNINGQDSYLEPGIIPDASDKVEMEAKTPVLTVVPSQSIVSSDNETPAPKIAWQDLRHIENEKEVVSKAISKLCGDVAIFSEFTENEQNSYDRTSLPQKSHLLICHYPPSLAVWKQIIASCNPSKIYLVDKAESPPVSVSAYLKRLLGLVRYVVNQKSGSIETTRLTAALAATDVASALGLALLSKIHLIEWYADAGVVYLDWLGNTANDDIQHLTEYHQLEDVLKQINSFRKWCASASLEELQQAVSNFADENTNNKDSSSEISFGKDEIAVDQNMLATGTMGAASF